MKHSWHFLYFYIWRHQWKTKGLLIITNRIGEISTWKQRRHTKNFWNILISILQLSYTVLHKLRWNHKDNLTVLSIKPFLYTPDKKKQKHCTKWRCSFPSFTDKRFFRDLSTKLRKKVAGTESKQISWLATWNTCTDKGGCTSTSSNCCFFCVESDSCRTSRAIIVLFATSERNFADVQLPSRMSPL